MYDMNENENEKSGRLLDSIESMWKTVLRGFRCSVDYGARVNELELEFEFVPLLLLLIPRNHNSQ